MVELPCNPSSWEAETGGPEVQGLASVCSQTVPKLGRIEAEARRDF